MDGVTPARIGILGVPVDCVTMATAVDFVDHLVASATTAGTVIAVNPEKVMKARQDPELLRFLNATTLLIPDGIGVVSAARILGLGHMERVPGVELMLALCQRSAEQGHRIFLYGAAPEINAEARAALERRHPGIRIVGNRHGYLPEGEMAGLVEEINASGAHILFIALGSPRQELWISRYLPSLKVKVCQGVGGSFDVIAGAVRRAPAAWRSVHLEWAYRLLAQPRRILRQTALPRFAWQVLTTRFARPQNQPP